MPHPQVVRHIAYGAHPLQVLDVHLPADCTIRTPAVFLIHGGGFIIGRKEDFEQQAQLFCREGFVVVNLSHRLIDASRFAQAGRSQNDGITIAGQLSDIDAAVRTYKQMASGWGTGTGKMYIAGHSAGAILSMLYLLQDGGHHEGIRAAGNWAGITDFSLPMDTLGGLLQPWQLQGMQAMYDKMLDYSALAGPGGDVKRISPYWIAQKRGGMPVISIYPEHNVVLNFPAESALGLMQTRRFHALLRSQHIAESFQLYQGCNHNFFGPFNAWERCIRETAAFFRSQ